MGDVCRMNQSERFMAAFGKDLNKALKIEGQKIKIVGQSLGYDSSNAMIRYYLELEIDGNRLEVETGEFEFDVEYADAADTADKLELLLGLSRKEIIDLLTQSIDGSPPIFDVDEFLELKTEKVEADHCNDQFRRGG